MICSRRLLFPVPASPHHLGLSPRQCLCRGLCPGRMVPLSPGSERGPPPLLLLLRDVEAVAKRRCNVTTWSSRKKKRSESRASRGESRAGRRGRPRPAEATNPSPRVSGESVGFGEVSAKHPLSGFRLGGCTRGVQSKSTEDAAPGSRNHGGETGGGDEAGSRAALSPDARGAAG